MFTNPSAVWTRIGGATTRIGGDTKRAKYERCVLKVKRQRSGKNPWAICRVSVYGRKKKNGRRSGGATVTVTNGTGVPVIVRMFLVDGFKVMAASQPIEFAANEKKPLEYRHLAGISDKMMLYWIPAAATAVSVPAVSQLFLPIEQKFASTQIGYTDNFVTLLDLSGKAETSIRR